MELLNTWLPPAVIIGVVIYTNRLLANGINIRIDDLRYQITRYLDRIERKLDNHLSNYEIRNTGRNNVVGIRRMP